MNFEINLKMKPCYSLETWVSFCHTNVKEFQPVLITGLWNRNFNITVAGNQWLVLERTMPRISVVSKKINVQWANLKPDKFAEFVSFHARPEECEERKSNERYVNWASLVRSHHVKKHNMCRSAKEKETFVKKEKEKQRFFLYWSCVL